MKLNYNNVLKLFAAGIFLLALVINTNVSVNKPFATLSDLVLMPNAQGETDTNSSSSPNYVYFEKLVRNNLYDQVATLSCGLQLLVKNVPSGVSIQSINERGLIGVSFDCEGWAVGKCDQNKVRVEWRPVATATEVCN